MRAKPSVIALIAGLGPIAALLWLRASPVGTIRATDLTVCLAGCSYDNIQAAVDAAQDGDVIKVATGVYTGVHSRPAPSGYTGASTLAQVLCISKTITVRGGYTLTDWTHSYPISYPTIVDAQGLGDPLGLLRAEPG